MRISVTDVDAYRHYMASDSMTLEDILARLKHEATPTPGMLAGRAFHSLLETANIGEMDDATIDGHTFVFNMNAELSIPAIRELKAEGEFMICGQPVTLVGKVDAMAGNRVYDHKLSARFDAERYADSFQWRAYLLLLNADRFTYNVFSGEFDGLVWNVWGMDTIDFYRYPMMEHDVLFLLDQYVEFAKIHLGKAA